MSPTTEIPQAKYEPGEIERDGNTTRFLRDRSKHGSLLGAKFGTHQTDISVIHFRDQAPEDVVLSVYGGGFSYQQSLSIAEARRIAAALLACADEAEQMAAVAQEAA